jgi:PAS domain S-box-containing protein
MANTFIVIPSSWKSILLFILMSLGIITAGVIFYFQQKNYIGRDKHEDLKNLNLMKSEEIAHWWRETQMDVQFIASTLVMPEEVGRIRSGDLESSLIISLQERLSASIRSREYKRIGFLAPDGHILASFPDSIPVPQFFLRSALGSDTIVSSNLYLSAGGTPTLQLASPVYAFSQHQLVRLGTLFLEIDPALSIYQMLQTLRADEPTIEAQLVRRDGDSVLFLSPLKERSVLPLTLRAPINSNTMATQAVQGIFSIEGIDYRGHAVYANASLLGVMDWSLVVKMDERDVFRPLEKIAWLSGIIVVSLILAAGAGIGMYGRQQAAQTYRRQLEDALDRKALVRHYEHLTKYAYDIIVLLDAQGAVVELNEAALAAFGCNQEEIARLTLDHFCTPKLKSQLDKKIRALGPDEGFVLEGWFRRKNGETFCGEMGMRVIDIEGTHYLQAVIRDITDRRRAEEAIRDSEARLRVLIANYPGIISLVDAEGTVKIAEGRGLKELGIASGQSVGKSIFEVYASLPSVTSAIRASLKGEESRSIQEMKGLSFETHFLPYRNEAGTIMGVLSLSTNITERLQVEDRLRRTEVRFHSLFNNMNEGVALHRVLYDENGVPNNYEIYEVNSQYETILGITRESVLNKPATEVYGVDVPPYMEEFSRVAETGKSFHFETYFPPMDKHFYISVASLGKGQFATIFIDITEQRKMQTQLQENEEKYRLLFETIEQGVVYQNRDGAIIAANPAAERILGLSLDQLQWRSSQDSQWHTIHSDGSDFSSVEHPSMISLRTGKPQKGVLMSIYHPSEGRHRWVLVDSMPLFNPGEDMPSQAYAFFIDITEAKEAEAKILELNSELVDKNRELEQIVYITSHDLRSPLVNIEGFSKEINRELQSYAKAVQHENDPEKTRSLLEALQKEVASSFCYISASTTKMDQLLTGLLKLSRLERLVITPKQVEMSALMENVVATMQYRLEELGAAVHVAPLPNCSGEETLLNQVFSNLLDNALKYLSPDRPGVVSIEGEDNGTEVIYRVIDNGCGIAPEFQRQVFEIFRRLDVSKPGDGLGLTICTKILQRLNGKIWLSSVAGQGSTFYVSLPSL